MRIIIQALPYIQIVLSVILVSLVLLQQSDADVGGAFGSADSLSATTYTRRGLERVTFNSTILIGILFALSAFLAIIIR